MILLAVASASFAQAEETANQDSVEVQVGQGTEAYVTHTIKPGESSRQLDLIPGTVSGMSVRDAAGADVPYVAPSEGIITLPPSDSKMVVEYTIRDALMLEGNVWIWNFRYLHETIFAFPEEIDTIYANEQPVHLGDAGGLIRCHGCQMRLEYTVGEPVRLYDIVWEEHEFTVAVRSHNNIESVEFHQPSMSISLDVEGGEFVTVIMPLELLGDPYQAYLEDEKVWFHEYRSNETHAWINVRPDVSGTVTVVGSTVIPEFPAVMATMVAASVPLLYRVTRHWPHRSKNRTRLSGNRTGDTLWYS